MNLRKTPIRSKTALRKTLSSKQLVDLICKGAENKHAEEIEVIDVRKASSICNYFIVCTANSTPQINAIAEGIKDTLHKKGVKMPRVQGKGGSNWIIIDFINIVAHIMGSEERKKYNLEDLWGKSGIIYHV
ncbi:MAG: ribosome silencing factor [Candidatus Margulisiibacteriota bacterium]